MKVVKKEVPEDSFTMVGKGGKIKDYLSHSSESDQDFKMPKLLQIQFDADQVTASLLEVALNPFLKGTSKGNIN